jgi:hypothetical protein
MDVLRDFSVSYYNILNMPLLALFLLLFSVGTEREQASVLCNSVTNTGSNKQERVQRHFVRTDALKIIVRLRLCFIKFKVVHFIRKTGYFETLCMSSIYSDFVRCVSLLVAVDTRVPVRTIRDFNVFLLHFQLMFFSSPRFSRK